MSQAPVWKKCRRCGKVYDWNPSVGVTKCPYCVKKDREEAKKSMDQLFNRNNKDEEDNDI